MERFKLKPDYLKSASDIMLMMPALDIFLIQSLNLYYIIGESYDDRSIEWDVRVYNKDINAYSKDYDISVTTRAMSKPGVIRYDISNDVDDAGTMDIDKNIKGVVPWSPTQNPSATFRRRLVRKLRQAYKPAQSVAVADNAIIIKVARAEATVLTHALGTSKASIILSIDRVPYNTYKGLTTTWIDIFKDIDKFST